MTSKGAALKTDSAPDEELEAQLPIPVGYHLLVAMPEVEKKVRRLKYPEVRRCYEPRGSNVYYRFSSRYGRAGI